MKQLASFLSRYFSPVELGSEVVSPEMDIELQMAGIWQGYMQVDGKEIQPVWFLLKADSGFEVFVSPFEKDPFRFSGLWEINDRYFSAVFNGRTDTWILEGVMNDEGDSIKGDVIIQGDLIEIIESDMSRGIFTLKK